MGFPKDLIDKIYSVMHPENLEEALDYLNKNDKDKFTHSYIPNNTTNVCSICGYKRADHAVDDIDDIIINPPKIEEKKEEIKNDIIDLIEDNDLLDDNDEDLEIKNMLNKYVNKFKNNNFINDDNRIRKCRFEQGTSTLQTCILCRLLERIFKRKNK